MLETIDTNKKQLIDKQLRREIQQKRKAAQRALDNVKLLGDTSPSIFRDLMDNLIEAEAAFVTGLVEGKTWKKRMEFVIHLASKHELLGLYLDQVNQLTIDPAKHNFEMRKINFARQLGYSIQSQALYNRIESQMAADYEEQKDQYKTLSTDEKAESYAPYNMQTWLDKILDERKHEFGGPTISTRRAKLLNNAHKWYNESDAKAPHLSALSPDMPELSEREIITVGLEVMRAFEQAMSILEVVVKREGGRTPHYIRLKEEERRTVLGQLESRSYGSTSNIHMICEPNELVAGQLDIKHRYMAPAINARPDPLVPGAAALEAMNAMQAVPYKVNEEVLEIAQALTDAQVFQILEIEAESKDELTERQLVQYGVFHRAIEGAAYAAQDERFFFPVFFDSRGRSFYAATYGFGPQSNKQARALLEFADARPLGKTGLEALYVQLGNALGHDKKELSERIELAQAVDVAAIAADPIANDDWLNAEEPLKALALIKDIATAVASGDPSSHLSHVICHVDGSCNGLQHLSLMGNDRRGALATNVIADDLRRDIYQDASDAVLEQLRRQLAAIEADDRELATKLWKKIDKVKPEEREAYIAELIADLKELLVILHKGESFTHAGYKQKDGTRELTPRISVGGRKMVKPGTMCQSYGVSGRTIRNGLFDDMLVANTAQAGLVTDALIQALEQLLPEAMKVRKWLVDSVRTMTTAGISPQWTLPTGTVVTQRYDIIPTKSIRLIGGELTNLPNYESDPESRAIDVNSHVKAIVANLVHSADAAALQMTACGLSAEGITNQSFVHDSYACAAGDMDSLYRILRQAHVELYREDFLENVRDGFSNQLNAQLPAYERDSDAEGFGLEEMLTSDYMFA